MKSVLKSLKQSARSMAVTVAAVFLMAAIFALPVPTASAATASSAAGRKPGLNDRYILTGIATRYNVVTGLDLNDNESTLLYCTIEDECGETWIYAYELGSEVPPVNQNLILIMNCNDTPDDIDDDIIEDILWCNCENAAEED
jgi:hypothetical protein